MFLLKVLKVPHLVAPLADQPGLDSPGHRVAHRVQPTSYVKQVIPNTLFSITRLIICVLHYRLITSLRLDLESASDAFFSLSRLRCGGTISHRAILITFYSI